MMNQRTNNRAIVLIAAMTVIVAASTQLKADTGMCGGVSITLPFTDVPSSSVFFCSIAEAYLSGLSNGTTGTTYSPSANVPREQMAAFVTRTLDQSLKRGSERAALGQFWTTQTGHNLGLTNVGSNPTRVKSDGLDLWVVNTGAQSVHRVRASDGRILSTTSVPHPLSLLIAMGKVFVATLSPSDLYQIDPAQPGAPASLLVQGLGDEPFDMAFDGERIWTANHAGSGSISIVTLSPLSVSTVNTGFNQVSGIIYDGSNIWITDATMQATNGALRELDPLGGFFPQLPVFDGTNIWVPDSSSANIVTVVRATGALSGTVLATLSGNGMSQPFQAAFDGERILVGNYVGSSVSLWTASDLTPIGTFSTGMSTDPEGACSDGLNFWIALTTPGKLARF